MVKQMQVLEVFMHCYYKCHSHSLNICACSDSFFVHAGFNG